METTTQSSEISEIPSKPTVASRIFQAVGVVTGVLDLSDPLYPVLLVDNYSYPVTVRSKVLELHQPGSIQIFTVYPQLFREKLGFSLRNINPLAVDYHSLKGCWCNVNGSSRLRIYSNNLHTYHNLHGGLNLIWDNAPPADGSFWEFSAELRGDAFFVTQAIGPFKSPPKYTPRKYKALPLSSSESRVFQKPILLKDKLQVSQVASDELTAVVVDASISEGESGAINSPIDSLSNLSEVPKLSKKKPPKQKVQQDSPSVATALPDDQNITNSSSEPRIFEKPVLLKDKLLVSQVSSDVPAAIVVDASITEGASGVIDSPIDPLSTPSKTRKSAKKKSLKQDVKPDFPSIETYLPDMPAVPIQTTAKKKTGKAKKSPLPKTADSQDSIAPTRLFLGKQLAKK
jgi:hypothetical protein